MILFDFLDSSLYWLVVLAGVGLAAMAALAILAAALKRGSIAEWAARNLSRAPTLRGRLLIGLILVGAIPVLTLPPILMLENVRARQLDLADELRADGSNLAHGMEQHVRRYVAGVDALAAHINTQDQLDRSTLNGWLLRHHKANPEFVSTWIADPRGDIVAATALLDGDQKPWVGPIAGVALMEFFQAAVENGGLYVSPVQKGVEPLVEPMIIISAPIFLGNQEPWGYLQVQLNLRRVYRNIVSYGSIPGRPAFLTDERNRVMVASPEIGFDRFQLISAHPVVTHAGEVRGGTYGFEGVIEKGQPSARYIAFSSKLTSGWKVYAIASIKSMQTQALLFMGLSLLWVLIVTFLSISLAGLYGGIVSDPLQALHRSMDIFDDQHTLKMVPPPPQDAPAEIASVFRRLRLSMEKSRDSYRNMLRAITEGEHLRHKVKAKAEQKPAASSGGKAGPASKKTDAGIAVDESAPEKKTAKENADAGMIVEESAPEKKTAKKKEVAGYKDRLDPLTDLAGREVFKEFFSDAWMLGYSDARPMSLLFFSIGFGEAREKSRGGSVADEVFQETGKALAKIGGRELDFVARIKTDRFVIVLPDTDLYGALVVAERARKALRDVLTETSGGETLGANVGVASITPTPAGDAASFVKVGQRVLVSAERRASSHLAYVDEELETHVLEPGEPLPSAPPVAEKLEVPKEESPAEQDPDSSGFALSLASTYAPLAEVEASDSDASAGEDRNPLLDSEEVAEAEKAPAEVALAESAPAEPAEEPEEDQTIYPTWSGTGVDLDDIDWDD